MLGIVSIAQRHISHGIAILLLSVVMPPVLFLGLGVTRTMEVLAPSNDSSTASQSAMKSMSTTETQSVADVQPIEPSPEELYIQDLLELSDFQARYIESVSKGRIPGVTFKLRNNGDQTLEEVKVVVFFKDAFGSVIAEEDYLPVLASEYNFSGDKKPLKSGYIWQMEQGKFYSAKSVPTEWAEGAAEAMVTEIRFAKEGSGE